jgi:DNA helicase IV
VNLDQEPVNLDQEMAGERRHLAESRAALARMLDTARMRVTTGEQVAGDRYTAETLGRMLKSYAKELAEEPDGPPYFGRLRFDRGEHRGQSYYIGRRHISGEAPGDTPIVIDWRAPVSRTFYQASARDPQGVASRRRYGWAGHPAELTGFEDESLGAGVEETGSRLVAEEIERPRFGPMRDIVATIQPEQDDLVRAGLDGSVCVQGGPGTGKTAVGLHRAAYLLYTYRDRLKRSGVLVIGPNSAFLRYISAVLPALGEIDVQQRTLDALLDRFPVTATDSPAAARVKHDIRMAEVLRRALHGQIGTPDAAITVPDGSYRWHLPAGVLARIVADIRADAPLYGIGRERLRTRVVMLLQRQAERRGETPGYAWAQRIGRAPAVKDLLDKTWPSVRPADLVAAVLNTPERYADGLLSSAEQDAIRRPRVRTAKSSQWTSADLVLIDEVAGLIEHPAGFGHIIVDETQDLSPMQCRALARRNEHGSMTVLGDLAQGTADWAAVNWPDQLAHLGKPKAPVLALTAGFRVPAVILRPANRLLAELDVDVPPTRSFRTDGTLRIGEADELAATVRAALTIEGSIAVIAASTVEIAAKLDAAGIAHGDAEADARVTLLPVTLANGLEYDHVILLEPADIVDAGPRGLNRLYVALTRAVSRLDILHRRPLPPALR